LPPLLKTESGNFPDADGYGPYDDYDIGSKPQFGSGETRFGTREQLQRCVAVLRANNIDTYADTVPHQRMGGPNGVYDYLGADGKSKIGRFNKTPSCFVGSPPRVPRDPIAGPVSDDFSFGDELCPINAQPPGYVMNGLIDAGDWLTRSLGVVGYRIDDVKGMAVEFVHKWLTSKSMSNNFGVAEYYDGNPQTLDWWVWQSGMEGRCAVFDFTTHFAVQGMCNNTSRWNMEQLVNAGYFRISPLNAVTFVENPDTDTDGFATVIWNKILGYAFILTSEGYPCVYYKDYSLDAGCYGLKPLIDNLIWIHENLAFGTTLTRFSDYQAYVYERQGYPGLLVGLSNDQYNGWRTLTVQTSFGPNVQLHDYSGHAQDVWTNENGQATISIPPNNNGQSYVCYSRVGYGQAFTTKKQSITQIFFGAADLDIQPILNVSTPMGRIWCDANTEVTAVFTAETQSPALTAGIATITLTDPTSSMVSANFDFSKNLPNTTLKFTTRKTGWHTLSVIGTNTPSTGISYSAKVTYTASQTI
jgi:alpha-amylase